jgi:multidrug efflux pump subunit AcrB
VPSPETSKNSSRKRKRNCQKEHCDNAWPSGHDGERLWSTFFGLGFAIVLIYLLIVVNFQSWLDPFIIVLALSTALAGIVWMLFLTHTTLSVPALTGAIMAMGVATANSILVTSFAREQLAEGKDAASVALEAGGRVSGRC